MRPIQACDTSRGSTAEPLLITMEQLQALLNISKTTAFRIIGDGDIESVQVGRRRMPVLASARAYVERLRTEAKTREAA